MSELPERLERRSFLRGAVLGAGVGTLALAGCGRPVTSGGGEPGTAAVPWWQQVASEPAQHSLLTLPYPAEGLQLNVPNLPAVKGISRQVVEWHHGKHHAGYVKSLNEIEAALAAMPEPSASANYSPFAELKRRETFNASGMFLHDIYWQNMTPGGAGLPTSSALARKINSDFGSFARWQASFVATAATPNTGWSILALAPYDGLLHNYACAFHDLGGVWGAVPLVALDVWEHAYYHDYGPDRASYVESFLRLVNWPAVARAFDAFVELKRPWPYGVS